MEPAAELLRIKSVINTNNTIYKARHNIVMELFYLYDRIQYESLCYEEKCIELKYPDVKDKNKLDIALAAARENWNKLVTPMINDIVATQTAYYTQFSQFD